MPSLTKAISRIERFYSSLPRLVAEAGLIGILFFLAWLDFYTGRNIHLSLFYAMICAFAGWMRGGRAVAVMVVVCTSLTAIGDRVVDSSVPLEFDLVNHGSRLILWSLVGTIMVNLRSRMDELDQAYDTIRNDVSAARSVQKAFLSTEIPKDERFDLAVKFRTARLLGGDYYVTRLIDDELRVLVADVSGKGAPAALVTGLLSGLFSEISRHHKSPAKVLRILDQEIASTLPDGMFITAFYFTLDLYTGEMKYASAGHDPPFLCRHGKGPEELMPTGLPVGLLGEFGIEETSLKLKPEDLLVLYTDGLVNACLPNGERMGDEAFAEKLETLCKKEASTITEELFAFTDSVAETDDDVVVLTLRIKAPVGEGKPVHNAPMRSEAVL